jgi:hypothetical protein
MLDNPHREAIVSLLPDPLREELERAEAQFRAAVAEALAAKGRATELIRTLDKPFEHAEAELETEYEALIRYHTGKLTKKIRWVLEAWADGQQD